MKQGESLASIAQKLLGDSRRFHELRGWDGPPDKLPAGTVLALPQERGRPAAPPRTQPGATALGAAVAAPVTWDMFPAEYRQELNQMEHDYETASEFRVPITQDQLLKMAQNGVNNMYDFAQVVWQGMDPTLKEAMPWAEFGLSHDTFSQAVQSYGDYYSQLTGQIAPKSLLESALKDTQGRTDISHFQEKLKTDQRIKDTFGWVQYGMNHEQFKQFKDDSKTAFGHVLSDQQAVNVLRDQHQTHTGSQSEGAVRGRPAQQGTLGEGQAAIR